MSLYVCPFSVQTLLTEIPYSITITLVEEVGTEAGGFWG